MTTDLAADAAVAPTASVGARHAVPAARTVIAGLTARTAARSGLICGAVFGIAIASSAVSYASLYKTAAQRHALAATYGSNHATATLFGPAPDLQTVAGFTAFKVSMTLMLLGAVWGLLTSTRLLRGEEDDGRWELLLAGRTTRRGATAQALAGLAVGVVVLWAVTGALTVLTGHDRSVGIAAGPALLFALAVVTTAAVFTAVGAVTSQLAATRRQAAAWAAALLGVAYAVRMVADAGIGLHGLIWASPLGWVEEAAPLTRSRPLALVPAAVLVVVLGTVATGLAGRRDLGASIVPDHDHARPRLRLLSGPVGLATRLQRPTVIGWWVAITIAGLLYGVISVSAGSAITGSSVHQVFSRLGATGTGAEAVLGVCFLVLGVLVGFTAAGQLTAARGEEASGRLENLLVRPLSPAVWLIGRLGSALAAVVGTGLLAGAAAWVGAASQHAGIGIGALLAAGVNLVPPAAVILGVGVVALAFRPRATSSIVYGYLGWSLLVVLVGGIGATDHWILDTSVFHQMATAPAVPVDWTSAGIMLAVAVVLCLVGVVGFQHRDRVGA